MPEWFSTSWGRAAMILVTAVVCAIFANIVLRRRREHEWQRLARRLRLKYTHDEQGPHVTGLVENRTVEMALSPDSSDSGGGIALTQVTVGVAGVPSGMLAEGTPGVIGDIANLADEHVETGDADFDRDVHVTGPGADSIRAYWTNERREAFRKLMQHVGSDQLKLSEGQLCAEERSALADRRRLRDLLEHMVQAAKVLDAPPRDANGETLRD